jgi:hypothetical protein
VWLAFARVARAGATSLEWELGHWDEDPEHGFVTLGMVYAPEFRPRSQQLVTSDEAWADAWHDYGFRGRLPKVDFGARTVVVFVESVPCAGGGRGGAPVVRLHRFPGGKLVPRLRGPAARRISCEETVSRPRFRGYAYALSVPRTEPAFQIVFDDSVYLRKDYSDPELPAVREFAPEWLPGLRVARPHHLDDVVRRSLTEALSTSPGSVSVVRAVVLRIDERRRVTLCEQGPDPACASVSGVRPAEGCQGYFLGDAAVTRTLAGFDAPIWIHFRDTYRCREGDRVQGMSDPNFIWGLERFRVAATASGAVLWTGSDALFGAEASVVLRYRFPIEVRPRSTLMSQLGDSFELSARARGLAGAGEPVWLLGLHPALTARAVFQHWTAPTLLGALLPETGVAVRETSVNAYLSWRLGLEYRLTPASYRQRPYRTTERLAFELAPSFVWVTGSSPDYWGGVSAGVTLW